MTLKCMVWSQNVFQNVFWWILKHYFVPKSGKTANFSQPLGALRAPAATLAPNTNQRKPKKNAKKALSQKKRSKGEKKAQKSAERAKKKRKKKPQKAQKALNRQNREKAQKKAGLSAALSSPCF